MAILPLPASQDDAPGARIAFIFTRQAESMRYRRILKTILSICFFDQKTRVRTRVLTCSFISSKP